MLEENGIITKSEHPDSKVKVLYKLTEKGIDLFPIMIEIGLWANKYYDIDKDRKKALSEIVKNKETYIKGTLKELKNISSQQKTK